MADARIRDLERRRSQGDAAAETQLLLERLRAGQVELERVELLAALGHEPAQDALDAPPAPSTATELREWLWELLPYGRLTLVRAAVALAHEALDPFDLPWTATPTGPHDAIEAAEQLTEGADHDAETLKQFEGYTLRAAEDLRAAGSPAASQAAFVAFHAVRTARLAVEQVSTKEFLHQVAQTLNTARGLEHTDELLQEAVEADLLLWALRHT